MRWLRQRLPRPAAQIGQLLQGMTAGTITVVNDGVEETYPLSTFMRSWVILGNMAITKS